MENLVIIGSGPAGLTWTVKYLHFHVLCFA